jgi:hypothetical protein
MAKIPETEFAEHAFTVKEAKAGPFIMCEPRGEDLSILGDGFLTLTLRPGTSIEKAEEIARYLGQNVSGIGSTIF